MKTVCIVSMILSLLGAPVEAWIETQKVFMYVLAIVVFLLIEYLFDRINKKITALMKKRMGESWTKYRLLFVAIYLLIMGLGLALGFCVLLLIMGDVPPVLLILKLVLVFLAGIFMAFMLLASVIWFLRALAQHKNEAAYRDLMKKAFWYLFLFAIGAVALVLGYRFWF